MLKELEAGWKIFWILKIETEQVLLSLVKLGKEAMLGLLNLP